MNSEVCEITLINILVVFGRRYLKGGHTIVVFANPVLRLFLTSMPKDLMKNKRGKIASWISKTENGVRRRKR